MIKNTKRIFKKELDMDKNREEFDMDKNREDISDKEDEND